jgi:hypothetical protein
MILLNENSYKVDSFLSFYLPFFCAFTFCRALSAGCSFLSMSFISVLIRAWILSFLFFGVIGFKYTKSDQWRSSKSLSLFLQTSSEQNDHCNWETI